MNIEKFKKRKWRIWFRVIHRDLGFFIFGLTVIYAISGIALNHIKDWNPSYTFTNKTVEIDDNTSKLEYQDILSEIAPELVYRKHFFRHDGSVKVFVKSGSVDISPDKNKAIIETISRRPLFYQINFLHYNRSNLWIWFSDVFAVILIIVSVTGLFIVKGKYGITKNGLYWALLGIAIPTLFLVMIL